MMKKIISACIFAILIVTLSLSVSASSHQYSYTINNKTIIFAHDTSFDEETRHHIVNHFVYGTSEATTYGLSCILFGHSYESSVVTTITHCVSDTDPRCLKEMHEVQVCTKCDDTISNSIGSIFISCCPEE